MPIRAQSFLGLKVQAFKEYTGDYSLTKEVLPNCLVRSVDFADQQQIAFEHLRLYDEALDWYKDGHIAHSCHNQPFLRRLVELIQQAGKELIGSVF